MESLKVHMMDEPAETEGSRRHPEGTAVSSIKPNSEVVPKATRRTLTIAYKLKVMETVAALREQGQGAVGAYLRKEGLYYSSIRTWEKLLDQGLLTRVRKGPQEKDHDALLAENKQLRRELEKTRNRLAKTELIVDLQKKLSSILDIEPPKASGRSDAE
jgi:transposase